MKYYFEIIWSIVRYTIVQLSILLLLIVAYFIYPFIYPFRVMGCKLPTFLWIFFNDSIDGDYGDPVWQTKQTQKLTGSYIERFILSYKWNVRRNPVFNYTGGILNTKGYLLTSIKVVSGVIGNSSYPFNLNLPKGKRFGKIILTFRLNGILYFFLKTRFKIGSTSILLAIGHHEFRNVFQLKFNDNDR